jgi:uncharacterized protein
MEDTSEVIERLHILLLSAFFGIFFSWIAWTQGFYRIYEKNEHSEINFVHVIGAFFIFFFVEFLLIPLIFLGWLSWEQGAIVNTRKVNIDPISQGWLNLIGIVIALICMAIYLLDLNKPLRQAVLGKAAFQGVGRAISDLLKGAMTWLLCYPWIGVISQAIALFLLLVYHGPQREQVAVKHLKFTISDPLLFWPTVIAVISLVPMLEETLFRGFLQTWLKKILNTGKAILVTSVVFTCFHFSTSQGINNIELLASLFLLSCYLGFIYEKQQSLWASIGLHGTFNAISVGMIIFSELELAKKLNTKDVTGIFSYFQAVFINS